MDETELPSLEEIKQMLERLKALDRQLQVFGAQIHQYKSHPLSDIELELLEAGLGVRLPADYRQFLHEIGYGAGPYYGLYSPNEVFRDLREEHIYGARLGCQTQANPSRSLVSKRMSASE
jgi:hypothetical protein